MVDPRVRTPHPHNECAFAARGIIRDVTHIVHVQHTNAEETESDGRQHDPCAEDQGVQIISTHHTDQAEKNEHTEISQSGIAVRILAERVLHRSNDGSTSKKEKKERLQHVP
ncbi:MAG TPA: hypothetical protein PK760_16450 [Flavobacteriales bacterium]|nr:hypothetical protein [Flavobacteriales bacterium]